MLAIVRETDDLEGSGRVRLYLRNPGGEPTLGPIVRLSAGESSIGAILDQVTTGHSSEPSTIHIDKHLRLHLAIPEGDEVSVEPVTCQRATHVRIAAPPAWSGETATETIKAILQGRPVCEQQTVPIFTYAGKVVMLEVVATEPDSLVVMASDTALSLETDSTPAAGAVGWRDIGGLERELERIRLLIEFPFRAPQAFARLGIEPPRGIILYGPPGTGKTLIVRALCNEIGAAFFAISVIEVLSAYYGESEKRLHEVFEKARAKAPALILIDEIDSLAPKRGTGTSEMLSRLVATLLTLMDGLADLGRVIVIGTTNRLNDLDPALRRPGRFEHEIHVGVPDLTARRQILAIQTRRMPLATDVDLNDMAARTPGFVGADLSGLCREAGYAALRRRLSPEALRRGQMSTADDVLVSHSDFLGAVNRIKPSAMREVLVQVPRDVSWASIGGLDELKRLMLENVIYGINRPEAYRAAGIRPARGLLLYGPPGTGKTLLAKAVANECGANFIAVRGPELRSKWFGESEEKIRFVFAKAREVAPSIIFFDELDALAPVRGRGLTELTDSLVNQFLTEMDGVEALENVFVLAATNAVELIDPALLRPGRFDLQVQVPLPDLDEREAIFRVHLRAMPVEDGLQVSELARATEGFSGAEIEAVCHLAGVLALRETDFSPPVRITTAHLKHGLDEIGRTRQRLKPHPSGVRMRNEL